MTIDYNFHKQFLIKNSNFFSNFHLYRYENIISIISIYISIIDLYILKKPLWDLKKIYIHTKSFLLLPRECYNNIKKSFLSVLLSGKFFGQVIPFYIQKPFNKLLTTACMRIINLYMVWYHKVDNHNRLFFCCWLFKINPQKHYSITDKNFTPFILPASVLYILFYTSSV